MITEDQLEQQCLGWFRGGGWETVFGPDIAHDGFAPAFPSRTLTTLRDTLLPKLLSGELPVAPAADLTS
jgi:type I restriction enzyme R subunit